MFFVFVIGRTIFACFSSVDNKAFTRSCNAFAIRFESRSAENKPLFAFSFLICFLSSSISVSIAPISNGDLFFPILFEFPFFNWRTSFARREIPALRRMNACTPHSSQMKYRFPFLSVLISRATEHRKQGSLALTGRRGERNVVRSAGRLVLAAY